MKQNEIIKKLYERAEQGEQVARDKFTEWFFYKGFKFVKINRPMYLPTYKIFHTSDAEYNEINHKIELAVMLKNMDTAHEVIRELHNAATLKEFNAILKREGVR